MILACSREMGLRAHLWYPVLWSTLSLSGCRDLVFLHMLKAGAHSQRPLCQPAGQGTAVSLLKQSLPGCRESSATAHRGTTCVGSGLPVLPLCISKEGWLSVFSPAAMTVTLPQETAS